MKNPYAIAFTLILIAYLFGSFKFGVLLPLPGMESVELEDGRKGMLLRRVLTK